MENMPMIVKVLLATPNQYSTWEVSSSLRRATALFSLTKYVTTNWKMKLTYMIKLLRRRLKVGPPHWQELYP